MDFLNKVRIAIKKNKMLKDNDKILVGVSGGPDSIALLHVLYLLRDEFGVILHVAHLNHMFRGIESLEDARFVKEVAENYQLGTSIESYDVPAYQVEKGLSAQVAAREVRYNFFHKIAKEVEANKVALGHHADDQAETVLINFLRGTGLTGLKGMSPVRDDFFIRPFLELRRKEIEDFCREERLSFRQDVSNLKPVYLRNRVRLELLSYIEKNYNRSIIVALNRLAEICRDDDACLEEIASRAYDKALIESNCRSVSLSVPVLLKQPLAIQRRVMRRAWRKLTGDFYNLSFSHLEVLFKLVNCAGAKEMINLPRGTRAMRSCNTMILFFERKQIEIPPYCYQLKIPGNTYLPEIDSSIQAQTLTVDNIELPAKKLPPNEAFIDFRKLWLPLYVRRRLPGDVFKPFGLDNKVKLKKFLIDRKIPREKRNLIPLITTFQEIIWVGGVRLGEDYKVTDNTNMILHLKLYN